MPVSDDLDLSCPAGSDVVTFKCTQEALMEEAGRVLCSVVPVEPQANVERLARAWVNVRFGVALLSARRPAVSL
jgi:hypothetical protein